MDAVLILSKLLIQKYVYVLMLTTRIVFSLICEINQIDQFSRSYEIHQQLYRESKEIIFNGCIWVKKVLLSLLYVFVVFAIVEWPQFNAKSKNILQILCFRPKKSSKCFWNIRNLHIYFGQKYFFPRTLFCLF